MLRFNDGTQAAVTGLHEIMAALYHEGREADGATADEIVRRLEEKNYIPPSSRREYRRLLLDAYREYVEGRKKTPR